MKIVLTSWMPREGLSDFQESVGHFDTQTLSTEFLHSNCEALVVFFFFPQPSLSCVQTLGLKGRCWFVPHVLRGHEKSVRLPQAPRRVISVSLVLLWYRDSVKVSGQKPVLPALRSPALYLSGISFLNQFQFFSFLSISELGGRKILSGTLINILILNPSLPLLVVTHWYKSHLLNLQRTTPFSFLHENPFDFFQKGYQNLPVVSLLQQ